MRFRLGKVFHADTYVFDIDDIVQSRVQAGGFQRLLRHVDTPHKRRAAIIILSARMPPPQPHQNPFAAHIRVSVDIIQIQRIDVVQGFELARLVPPLVGNPAKIGDFPPIDNINFDGHNA